MPSNIGQMTENDEFRDQTTVATEKLLMHHRVNPVSVSNTWAVTTTSNIQCLLWAAVFKLLRDTLSNSNDKDNRWDPEVLIRNAVHNRKHEILLVQFA